MPGSDKAWDSCCRLLLVLLVGILSRPWGWKFSYLPVYQMEFSISFLSPLVPDLTPPDARTWSHVHLPVQALSRHWWYQQHTSHEILFFHKLYPPCVFFHLAWHPARENQPSTLHGLVLPVHHFFLIPVPCREACSPTLTGFVPMISLWGIHLISQQILPVTGARLSRARHSQRNEGLREVVKVPEGWLVAYATLRFHLYLTHCTSSMYSWQHPTQLLIDSPGGWSGYFRRLANKIDSSFSPTYQYFEAIPNNKRGNLYNL